MNNGAPLSELLLRLAIIAALVGALWTVLRYVWKGLVDRVVVLEAWRTKHEDGHVQVLLKLQDLENQARSSREVLERVELAMAEVTACVNRRRPIINRRNATTST